jgi:hypothetical protein
MGYTTQNATQKGIKFLFYDSRKLLLPDFVGVLTAIAIVENKV